MEQAGELDFAMVIAVKHKMTRGFHSRSRHPVAAVDQVINIGVRRKVGARFCAWPGGFRKQVAQRLPDQTSVTVCCCRTELLVAPSQGPLNVLAENRR